MNGVFDMFVFFIFADCLHLQLYRDSKDRYKQGMTKASLSLEHFLGVESGNLSNSIHFLFFFFNQKADCVKSFCEADGGLIFKPT